MTAYALKGDKERCLEAGMDGYVAKPIRAQELLDAIALLFPADQPCARAGGTAVVQWAEALEAVQGIRRS